jgi:hypothetical protein
MHGHIQGVASQPFNPYSQVALEKAATLQRAAAARRSLLQAAQEMSAKADPETQEMVGQWKGDATAGAEPQLPQQQAAAAGAEPPLPQQQATPQGEQPTAYSGKRTWVADGLSAASSATSGRTISYWV